ncbi:MAG: hypothetical protein ACTHON_17155 [Humibacter sp.]
MTTYLGSGEVSTHRTDYTPEWLGKLADDVTLEAAVMNGIATGPEAVRAILGFARTLYDYQEFNVIGRYGENDFVEDYVATVRGQAPIGSVVVIRYNDVGLVSNIVINHRPLSSVLLWSGIMSDHFADTEYAKFFLQPAELEKARRVEASR